MSFVGWGVVWWVWVIWPWQQVVLRHAWAKLQLGSEDKSLVRESIDAGRKWLDSKTAPALASRDTEGRVNTNGEFIDNLGGELASTITQIWAGSKIPTPWAAKPGAGVLARLRPSALTILFGGRQAEETANKAEKAGRGQKAQLGLGLATGTWEMAVESLSQIYGAQAAANPAVGNAVARAIRGRVLNILGEGSEEALQAGGEGAMEKLAGIDDRSWSEIGKQAAIEAGMALLSTGLIEGGNVAGAFSARRSAEFANREQDRADLSASVGAAEFAASDVTAPAPQQEGGPHETELPSEIAQRTAEPEGAVPPPVVGGTVRGASAEAQGAEDEAVGSGREAAYSPVTSITVPNARISGAGGASAARWTDRAGRSAGAAGRRHSLLRRSGRAGPRGVSATGPEAVPGETRAVDSPGDGDRRGA